jgi:hypothetical protein
MNEVSIRIGGRGTATGWGGESGGETGESELLNMFKTGIGDSGRVKDTALDGFSPTEISCDALIWAGGVETTPDLCCSCKTGDGTSIGAVGASGASGASRDARVAVEGNNEVGERATRRRSVGGGCLSSK